MADRGGYVQVQHGQYGGGHHGGQQQHGRQMGEQMKGMFQEKAPSASQALTVATLFPLGGLLLVLSGLALAGTVVGLAVATPVFLLFSPMLVPAALTIGLAVTGFLTSGALGLGGLSSPSRAARRTRAPEEVATPAPPAERAPAPAPAPGRRRKLELAGRCQSAAPRRLLPDLCVLAPSYVSTRASVCVCSCVSVCV
ncbi:unnamed protein product [Triticum turgidum subsp. durum]|uniref:Oleosin n=1 Tax=Triticum turgidum subsp. durum TaxID=4567 RepID=A0A9R0STX4_TRITD|nr:unnamed protein product [Triticum turgidum subsp. durum]